LPQWEYASLYLTSDGDIFCTEHSPTQDRTYATTYDPSTGESPSHALRRELAALGQRNWELVQILFYDTNQSEIQEEWILKRHTI